MPLGTTIVACIGQHADFEQRNGLHLFIGFWEHSMFEEEITPLLDHIVQGDKGGVVLPKRLLKSLDGFFDALAVLACRSLLGLGANEAIGEDGLNQRKDLLALRLSSHDPASSLGLAAPLPVPMGVRRVDQLHDMFPGWASSRLQEVVKLRPELDQGCIDHRAAGIEQA